MAVGVVFMVEAEAEGDFTVGAVAGSTAAEVADSIPAAVSVADLRRRPPDTALRARVSPHPCAPAGDRLHRLVAFSRAPVGVIREACSEAETPLLPLRRLAMAVGTRLAAQVRVAGLLGVPLKLAAGISFSAMAEPRQAARREVLPGRAARYGKTGQSRGMLFPPGKRFPV